ncbi:hypothetical protein WMY93_000449 [Mugilogobius chulae]|uniref:Uncharacterized protein n=1 Tax=Mugilogobius chulae TaxID=88201 RepID=A0AAW0PZD7_9GOBI
MQMYGRQQEKLNATLHKQMQLEMELEALRGGEAARLRELSAEQRELRSELEAVHSEQARQLSQARHEQHELETRLEQLRQQGCACEPGRRGSRRHTTPHRYRTVWSNLNPSPKSERDKSKSSPKSKRDKSKSSPKSEPHKSNSKLSLCDIKLKPSQFVSMLCSNPKEFCPTLSELRQRLERAEADRQELQDELRREREAREKLERTISQLKQQMTAQNSCSALGGSPSPPLTPSTGPPNSLSPTTSSSSSSCLSEHHNRRGLNKRIKQSVNNFGLNCTHPTRGAPDTNFPAKTL